MALTADTIPRIQKRKKSQIKDGNKHATANFRRRKQSAGGYPQVAEQGHEVVLVDYFKIRRAGKYAAFNEVVSTFDVAIEIAKKYRVDGVMTMGTDQPVYTVARGGRGLTAAGVSGCANRPSSDQ